MTAQPIWLEKENLSSDYETALSRSAQPEPKRKEPPFAMRALQRSIRFLDRWAPQQAGRLVNRIWFQPQRHGAGSRFEHLLDHPDSYTQLRIGVNDIPVYSWGDGPVILCAHGWSGAGIQFGALIEPLVRLGYRVVTFDAPGHGRAQGDRTNIFEMRDTLIRVAHLFGHPHAVIGHSLGAVSALLASEEIGASRVILLNPPRDLETVVSSFGRTLDIPENTMSVHRRLLEQEFGGMVWEELDMIRHAAALRLPGLIVSDLNDEEISWQDGQELAAQWRGARFLKTSGLGHYRVLRDEAVRLAIIEQIHGAEQTERAG